MTPGHNGFEDACKAVQPLDETAMAEAREHEDRLTKPRGSLGRIEEIGVTLAGIGRQNPPPLPSPAFVAVFAGDHGVVASGVTPWPSEVTRQMVANFSAGGAAINVFARQVGAQVVVVDVGVAGELDDAEGLMKRKVRAGTRDLSVEPAMTEAEAYAALEIGCEVANALVDRGARCLVTGDMGIGNTTPSAALIAHFTGSSPAEVTGRGTGIDDSTLATKVAAVTRGLARVPAHADPVAVLSEVGGLEIAALAGFIVAGAARSVPVVVDGVISTAALVVAHALCPAAASYCFAGHLSTEPGAGVALAHLGMEPILNLSLRLGEGTGACLAVPVLQAAARILNEMATFDQAGVSQKG